MPFSFQATGTTMPEGPYGPTVRTGVQAGADVIDLTGMIAGLEAARKPGGGGR